MKLTDGRFFNEFNSKPQLAPRAGAGYDHTACDEHQRA